MASLPSNVHEPLLERTRSPARDHVFTLHAELEGMKLLPVLRRLMQGWRAQGYELVSMRTLLAALDDRQLAAVARCSRARFRAAAACWPCRRPANRLECDRVPVVAFKRRLNDDDTVAAAARCIRERGGRARPDLLHDGMTIMSRRLRPVRHPGASDRCAARPAASRV